MTVEEELIQRYFDAFNSHDIEGVMACFHENPVVVDATGTRLEGREEVRQDYETGFALVAAISGCSSETPGAGSRNRISMARGHDTES
jgi:ketosteroid isomerase-like protein